MHSPITSDWCSGLHTPGLALHVNFRPAAHSLRLVPGCTGQWNMTAWATRLLVQGPLADFGHISLILVTFFTQPPAIK